MVPCLASPAAAEISTSDLTGTWLVRGLVAGASVDNGAALATGSVTFDATGTVTAGSLLTALNEPFPMAPGSLVVSAEGRLTGTLGVGTDDSAFQGRLVRDGAQAATRIVGTLTRGFGTPASRSMFIVMSKATAGATFAQDPDGTGMWRVKSLLLPELPLHVPDVIDGVIVVEPDGTISGGLLTSIVNEIDLSEFIGTLTLDTAGNFSGTLSIPAFAETSTFSGRMSPDKSLMLGAIERRLSDARQLGLFEMARLPGADAPSPRQLQPGTWELVSLQVQAEQGTVDESLAGTIELEPAGAITGGALIGLDGQVDTIVEGSYSTAASGEAFVQVFTEARTLTIFGTLLPSLNQVFGYDVLDTDRAPDAYGFVNLVRVDPVSAPAASTVQFQAARARRFRRAARDDARCVESAPGHRHHRIRDLYEPVERRQFACAQRRGNGSLLGRSGGGMSVIFTGPNPALSTFIRTGEALFGATVVEIELGGLNNRGEIAFRAVLSSGRQVIGVATPPGL